MQHQKKNLVNLDSSDDSNYELVPNETSRGTLNKVGITSQEDTLNNSDRVVDIYSADQIDDHEEYMKKKRYQSQQSKAYQEGLSGSNKDGTKTPVEDEWFTGDSTVEEKKNAKNTDAEFTKSKFKESELTNMIKSEAVIAELDHLQENKEETSKDMVD